MYGVCLGLTKAVHACRVGQNRIIAYTTVYLVISLLRIPYTYTVYIKFRPYIYTIYTVFTTGIIHCTSTCVWRIYTDFGQPYPSPKITDIRTYTVCVWYIGLARTVYINRI
jgi:hypothetical protein